jgi:2'-5' RNA ligase
MRRLFAALPVPDSFAAKIAALPRRQLDAEWVPPEDLHITLRFLGEVEEGKAEEVRAALASIRKQPFPVEIEGLGAFHKKQGSVLWAGIASTRKLTALAADINLAVERLGFEMPRIPYVPHITLARLKSARGIDAYIEAQGRRLRHSWQAEGFALMESGIPGGESGARYKIDSFFDFPQYR